LDGRGCAGNWVGRTDGRIFLAFVEHVLCPSPRPGDVVVMDNPGSHKATRMCEPD
jgi:hypothetical protein